MKTQDFITAFVGSFLFMFLVTAFIYMEINPAMWTESCRVGYILFSVFMAIVVSWIFVGIRGKVF